MGSPGKRYYRADVLFGQCEDKPAVLEAVQFHGIKITKQDALVKEVAELYKSGTLHDLINNSSLAAKHFQEVGLMEDARVYVDSSGKPDGYVVNFAVKEPKSFTLGAKLGMSTQGDADMSLHAAKQSFGRGEVLNSSYTYTVKGDHSFNLSGSKPLLGWQKYANWTASLSRSFAFLPWNKSNLEENALVLGYSGEYFARRVLYALRMNTIWRTLRATPASAFAVREHAGHTLKVSAENIIAFDSRDRPILSTRGILARVSNEVAGAFGMGDASFTKQQLDLQASAPLFANMFLSASVLVKNIQAVGTNELHLLDRAYLGGQHDVRGFALNSIGTRAEECCLGGGSSLAGAIHVFRPLIPADSLFLHAFLVSGSVASVRSRNVLRDLMESQRVAAGVGLTFVFRNIFRLELNYVHPIKMVPGDTFSRGVHLGAGINFL